MWLIIIQGNLIGALVIASLLNAVDDVVQAREGYIVIGHHLIHYPWKTLLISSLMAGWLMALGAWLVLATPPDFSQIACIYIVTFLIGAGGLHHSIAGSAEMFTAWLISSEFTFRQVGQFIGVAHLGNMCGGSIFVGVLNYAHIRQTQPAHEE